MSSSINGISRKQLRRYVAMREKFDRNAKVLASLTSLLSSLQHAGDDRIEVDPVALGNVHQLMEHHILNCWEVMDDFIYLQTALAALKEPKKKARKEP